jgi:hypothetical protein
MTLLTTSRPVPFVDDTMLEMFKKLQHDFEVTAGTACVGHKNVSQRSLAVSRHVGFAAGRYSHSSLSYRSYAHFIRNARLCWSGKARRLKMKPRRNVMPILPLITTPSIYHRPRSFPAVQRGSFVGHRNKDPFQSNFKHVEPGQEDWSRTALHVASFAKGASTGVSFVVVAGSASSSSAFFAYDSRICSYSCK